MITGNASVSESPERRRHVPVVQVCAVIVTLLLLAGAGYALLLMRSITRDLQRMSAGLSRLESMSSEMRAMNGRLDALQEANARMARMEQSLAYVPKLSQTGDEALAQSKATNAKIEITNQRLMETDACLIGAVNQMASVTGGLERVPTELSKIGGTMDKLSGNLGALNDMREMLAGAGPVFEKANTSIAEVSKGFLDTQSLLQGMSGHLSALPSLAKCFEKTNTNIDTALASIEPLRKEIPRLATAIDEMNRNTTEMAKTSAEMSKLTKEMNQSVKRAPKQGALGIGILTAAQLLAH